MMPGGLQIADMRHRRVEHAGRLVGALRREVAAGLGAAIDHRPLIRIRLGEGGEPGNRAGLDLPLPLVGGEIERARRQRLVGRDARLRVLQRRLAGLEIVLDQGEPLGRRLLDLRVEQHRHVAEIVEQGVEAVVEQRHPVFEAGIAPALAHGLVEPVVAGRGAEARQIALAEAPDRLGGELHLAHRHQIEGAQGSDGPLRLRIEGADRLEGVAEEVEADRVRQTGRRQIEDAAAHGVFAPFPCAGIRWPRPRPRPCPSAPRCRSPPRRSRPPPGNAAAPAAPGR